MAPRKFKRHLSILKRLRRSKDLAATSDSGLGSVTPPSDSSATTATIAPPIDTTDPLPPPVVSTQETQQKLGLFLLTPRLPADQVDQSLLDIVAIHGINGGAFKTWTHESGALWLRDFLPKDINGGARVFSFGYDSEVALTKSRATLDDFAWSLLNKLKLERQGKALTISQLRDESEFPFLRTCIKGIFFLGTPHCGSDAIKWPQLLANISTVCLYTFSGLTGSTRKDLLHNLERNSDTLKDISPDFSTQVKDIKIFSCIEQHTTPPFSKLIVDRYTGVLGLPEESIITMDGCDHRSMCRFPNRDNQNYRVLTSRINELLDNTVQSQGRLDGMSLGAHLMREVSVEANKSETLNLKDCMKYLYFKDMEARQHEIHPATMKTCEWLLNHDVFRRWTLQNGGLLWIKGNPGTGKSTAIKYALQKTNSNNSAPKTKLIILSFFFHNRGSELQHTLMGFYRSILYQILDQDPSALSDLLHEYSKNCETKGTSGKAWDWHEAELRAYLESSISKILESFPIRLFADALDEGGEAAAVELVKEFQHLLSQCRPTSSKALSICFSCRRYPIIDYEGELEISIDHENSNDIETYIRSRLQKEKHQIIEAIIQRSSNSFQWARLVVDRVEQLRRQAKTEKMIKEEILRIPPDLNDLYRGLLESIREEEKCEVMNLFQWILFAFRPLTLHELRYATAILPDSPYMSFQQCLDGGVVSESNEEMETRVKVLSRGLAEIEVHNKIPVVQLIHESVSDFLYDEGLRILFGEKWESLDQAIGLSHHILCRSCIRYIGMEEIVKQTNMDWFEADRWLFHFLRYAVTSWVPHAVQASTYKIPQADLLNDFHWPSNDVLHQWINIDEDLQEGYRSSNLPPKTTLLHIASEHGFLSIIRAILNSASREDTFINAKADGGQTPLLWAVRKGHTAVVQLLLNTGKVHVDIKDRIGRTSLSYAAQNGANKVVQLLLNTSKVDVDSEDIDGRTPLSFAADSGELETVKLLLERKPDVNLTDKYGRTPLSYAAEGGQLEVVKLLHDTGKADVGKEDIFGSTPLDYANDGKQNKELIRPRLGVAMETDCNYESVAKLLSRK